MNVARLHGNPLITRLPPFPARTPTTEAHLPCGERVATSYSHHLWSNRPRPAARHTSQSIRQSTSCKPYRPNPRYPANPQGNSSWIPRRETSSRQRFLIQHRSVMRHDSTVPMKVDRLRTKYWRWVVIWDRKGPQEDPPFHQAIRTTIAVRHHEVAAYRQDVMTSSSRCVGMRKGRARNTHIWDPRHRCIRIAKILRRGHRSRCKPDRMANKRAIVRVQPT